MVLFCVVLMILPCFGTALLAPSNLRVEGLKQEVAFLSESRPLFSFVPPPLPAGAYGTTQQSYRITVSEASGPTGHGAVAAPLWDSGDIASQKTLALVSSNLA